MPIEHLESHLAEQDCGNIMLINGTNLRVICSNSLEHAKIASLSTLGLSSKEIEIITGFNQIEFQHLLKE